jgi:hypothetical protein
VPDLSLVVNDPDVAVVFVVERSQNGYFGAGGWSDNYTTLPYYGIVSSPTPTEIEALPEADRVHGSVVINCELPLYVTRLSADGGSATSDIVIYGGEKYRIVQTHDYSARGFWWAVAVRMPGA